MAGVNNPVYTQTYDPAPPSNSFANSGNEMNKNVEGYAAPPPQQATYAQPGYVQPQPVYAQQPGVYTAPAYGVPQVQVVQGNRNVQAIRPNPGFWGSQICDWPSNLFPSCYCVCCACCGIWLIGQMAEKHNFGELKTIVIVWAVLVFIGFILDLIFGNSLTFWFGFLTALIYSIMLRIHIARKDRITECGSAPACGECCIGFWCFSCSVSQMARYTYGYTLVFDGDARIDRPDNYAPLENAGNNYPV